jgi:MFS family permease
MRRNVCSIILGVILSFLLPLLGFYVFIVTGVSPIGKDMQLVSEYQSFDKIMEALSAEEFLQLQDQAFQFIVLLLFPVVSLLTGLLAASISRRKFWLVGLISVTPFTILSIIMEAGILAIPLTILYLGLGSLGGFIAGYFKKKKMKA